MSTSETITKTDLKNILEAAGNIGQVDSTPTPTAGKVSEFDAAANINSTDMSANELETFLDNLDPHGGGGGGSGTPIPTANTTAAFDSNANMNSSDMTTAQVDTLVGNITSAGGSLIDFFYPVGSYYETSDITFNPNIRWGGTWELESEGQVHISSGVNYVVGDTGGEAEVTLTTGEIPAHTHGSKSLTGTFDNRKWGSSAGDGIVGKSGIVTNYANASVNANAYGSNGSSSSVVQRVTINATHEHDSVGGGGAHNNMPPYVVVNRWHRTA